MKKRQKLSCVKLAICPDHPRRPRLLKFCMRGRVWEVVIYFKFHENRSRGLGAVGGRKSPSHWQGPWLIQQLVLPYKRWCDHHVLNGNSSSVLSSSSEALQIASYQLDCYSCLQWCLFLIHMKMVKIQPDVKIDVSCGLYHNNSLLGSCSHKNWIENVTYTYMYYKIHEIHNNDVKKCWLCLLCFTAARLWMHTTILDGVYWFDICGWWQPTGEQMLELLYCVVIE